MLNDQKEWAALRVSPGVGHTRRMQLLRHQTTLQQLDSGAKRRCITSADVSTKLHAKRFSPLVKPVATEDVRQKREGGGRKREARQETVATFLRKN